MMNNNDRLWAEGIFEKFDEKMRVTVSRTVNLLPYTTVNGRYTGHAGEGANWWTNGFWPGLLWMMHGHKGNEIYRQAAEEAEALLDAAFKNYDGINHDLGFMWHISAGANYRATGNDKSRLRATYAANLMMGRFNLAGRFIRAWLPDETIGWSIIDAMMNLPLLFWASEEYRDPRFAQVAQAHADMTLNDHLRPDGSVRHIVVHDHIEGGVTGEKPGQGYELGSSWSRGHAWALYGFALSFRYTQKTEYLDAAKRVAHYFIANVCGDWLTRCDFRSPAGPVVYDSTAGAIAAAGLLEIESHVPELEKPLYRRSAMSILQTMEREWCDWSHETDGVLGMGSEMYHKPEGRHMHIVYGDFFFADALSKLLNKPSVW